MKLLAIHRDYETRSCADLKKVGAHVYAEHPTTEILCAVFLLHYEDGTERLWRWFPGMELLPEIREHIAAGGVLKGHNAAFEQQIDRAIMGPRYGWPVPKIGQLDCTLARCAAQALPLDLARACQALALPYQKDQEGHRLMLQMCKPRKPRKGEDPAGIYWHFDAEKLQRLVEYCEADVLAETRLDKALVPLQPVEQRVWQLDQIINNRGVQVDLDFVDTAECVVTLAAMRANEQIRDVTGGQVRKVTDMPRLKQWAKSAHGIEFKLITKERRNGDEYEAEAADREALEDMLADDTRPLPIPVRRAFEIRLEAGKASLRKLAKFRGYAGDGNRARGNLQYHGAGPGRWAGRGIQLQNMVRKGITEPGGWDAAYRDLCDVAGGDGPDTLNLFELIWGSPFDVISRMMRGAVIAKPGHRLIFGDYSNVEARGCVWSAGQWDQVDLFASGGKIYEEMGAAIFGISVDEVIRLHKTLEDIIPRFVGKETVLGCGYGMGPVAFQRNAKKKGRIILPLELCYTGVYGWRDRNPRVVELWRELEDAAKAAIENPGQVFTAGPFSYRVKGKWLQCRLPSGRVIWYRRPSLKPATADLEQLAEGETVPRYRWKIHYWGVNGMTKQWQEETTWGGKLLENCVQGMCRDFLAGAILRLEAASYPVVLTVHDEAISEVPLGFGSKQEFGQLMTVIPPWAKRFPLKADMGEGTRYAKG